MKMPVLIRYFFCKFQELCAIYRSYSSEIIRFNATNWAKIFVVKGLCKFLIKKEKHIKLSTRISFNGRDKNQHRKAKSR